MTLVMHLGIHYNGNSQDPPLECGCSAAEVTWGAGNYNCKKNFPGLKEDGERILLR